MAMRSRSSPPALLACLAALAGCVSFGGTPDPGTPAPLPSALEVHLASPPDLYVSGTTVEVVLRSFVENASYRAGLALPPHVQLLEGDLDHEGVVPMDAPVRLVGKLKAEPGQDVRLRAWAEQLGPRLGSRYAPHALLGVRYADGESTLYTPVEAPPAFQVDLGPDRSTSRALIGRVVSPIDLDGELILVLPPPPNGFLLQEGTREWAGTFPAGQPVQRSWRLADGAPDGTYLVGAYFYPDASVDGGIYDAQVLVRVDRGQYSIARE